jgi:hypothetical protein
MKKVLVVLTVLVLGLLLTQVASAQSPQGVTLTVNQIALLSVPAGPIALTITTGTPGVDQLTPVSAASTYSWTHNHAAAAKITAKLSTALPVGYTLTLTTTPNTGKGTGVTNQTIADAVAKDVVTAMSRGFDLTAGLSYTFGALASAADLTAGQSSNTVTYTIVAP